MKIVQFLIVSILGGTVWAAHAGAASDPAQVQRCDAALAQWQSSYGASLQSAKSNNLLGVAQRPYFEAQLLQVQGVYNEYKASGLDRAKCEQIMARMTTVSNELNSVIAAATSSNSTSSGSGNTAVSQREIARCDAAFAQWQTSYGASLESAKNNNQLGVVQRPYFETQPLQIQGVYNEYKANGLTTQECDQLTSRMATVANELNSVIAAATKGNATSSGGGNAAAVSQKETARCDAALSQWQPEYSAAFSAAQSAGKLPGMRRVYYLAWPSKIQTTYTSYQASGLTTKECDQLIGLMLQASKEIKSL